MGLELADDIWTMDGPEIVFAGAPMHTRMTVVRLRDGRLWVHSPIELKDEVRAFVAAHGSGVAALIAPNKFHYLFVEPWREAFPDARLFAEATLLQKVPTLAGAEVLTDSVPELYSEDIDQVVFGGNRLFQEVVFFHKPSRSLIFTDLMINLRTEGISTLPRLFLQFEGVTHPNGGIPRMYRWLTTDRKEARRVLGIIRGWNPIRILFCHGEQFELDADALIDREFAYLD